MQRKVPIRLDHPLEMVERVVLDLAGLAVAAGGLEGAADAGAIDEDALLPVSFARLSEGGIDLALRGNVDPAEGAPDFAGHLLAELRVEVEQRHSDAVSGQPSRRRGAEPRSAAGDHRRHRAVELHRDPPSKPSLRAKRRNPRPAESPRMEIAWSLRSSQ